MPSFFRPAFILAVFIYPICLTAQNSITTDSVLQLSTCPGQELLVTFDTDGDFDFFNTFYAELSDGSGDFSSPDTIGSTFISFVHIILVQLPDDLPFGLNYKVRVISSSPEVTGEPCPNSIFITTIPGLDEVNANPDEPICAPGTVSIEAGFGGSEYEWSNGETTQNINVSQSGDYSVTITDIAGCKYYPDPVQVTIYDEEATPVLSREANILSSSPSISYQWYQDGIILPADTNQSLEVLEEGSYFVVTSNEYGCWKASTPLEVEFADAFTVSPNPFSNEVNIESGLVIDETFGWKLFNMYGQVVGELSKKKMTGEILFEIGTELLEVGFYVLEVNYKDRIYFYHLLKQ